MKKTLVSALFFALISIAVPARAQNPNYDQGPVWRVTYFHIKPGMADAFWKDFRDHGKPVLDEDKKQGLISDYKFFTNATTASTGDWDVAIAILFPNWAALDQLDAKGASIAVKHYGSRETLFEMARKRNEIREVVSSHLAREVTLK